MHFPKLYFKIKCKIVVAALLPSSGFRVTTPVR